MPGSSQLITHCHANCPFSITLKARGNHHPKTLCSRFACALASTAPCRRPARCCQLRVSAIGFNLGDESSPKISFERRAAKLLRDTKRVLVYQSILKTKPVEAFLNLLKSLQQNSKDSILTDYSRFYQEVSRTHCIDFRDFILEEVLVARDNAWARELSRGDPKSKKLQAAANDLQILQSLACENEEIAGMVRDAMAEVPDVWLRAALNAGGAVDLTIGAGFHHTIRLHPSQEEAASKSETAIQAPISAEKRGDLKAAIRNLDTWSDATTMLSSIYRNHGFGLTSQNTMLQWRDSALSAFQDWQADPIAADDELQDIRPDYEGWENWPQEQSRSELIHDMEDLLPIIHKYGVLGLRFVFMSPAESAVEKWSTLRELTLLFRALKPHSRVNFLVIAAISPRNNNRVAEDLATSLTKELAYLTPPNTAVRFCDYSSQFNYL